MHQLAPLAIVAFMMVTDTLVKDGLLILLLLLLLLFKYYCVNISKEAAYTVHCVIVSLCVVEASIELVVIDDDDDDNDDVKLSTNLRGKH